MTIWQNILTVRPPCGAEIIPHLLPPHVHDVQTVIFFGGSVGLQQDLSLLSLGGEVQCDPDFSLPARVSTLRFLPVFGQSNR